MKLRGSVRAMSYSHEGSIAVEFNFHRHPGGNLGFLNLQRKGFEITLSIKPDDIRRLAMDMLDRLAAAEAVPSIAVDFEPDLATAGSGGR